MVGVLLLAATLAVAAPGAGAAHHPVALDGVVTFEGAPLPGATVRVGTLVDYEGWMFLDVVGEVVTAGDGSWALAVDGPGPWALDVVPPAGSAAARTWSGDCAATREYYSEWRPDGEVDWTVRDADMVGCIDSITVASGGSASIDVAMVPGATVEGSVVGAGGDPVPGATVTVQAESANETGSWRSRSWSTTTAADGSYAVQGIAPDAAGYNVRFTAPPMRRESTSGWVDPYPSDAMWLPMASGQVLVQSPVLEPAPCGAAPPFSDVADPPGDIAYDGATCGEVAWLADAGITNGYSDGTFRPSATLTRGAWITFLWRLAGEPTGYPDPGFSDVPPSLLFYPAVSWAKATGVANGYPDGTYGPGLPVSVQAAVVMAWRQAGSPAPPYDIHPFTDLTAGPAWDFPAGHPFRSSLRWALAVTLIDVEALEHFVINPDGFTPVEPATRLLATSIVYDLAARLGS